MGYGARNLGGTMQNNKQIDKILQKRMDRKDFLKHVAMGAAVITGAAGVVKLLKPNAFSQFDKPVSLGYGSSTYGGSPTARTATQKS